MRRSLYEIGLVHSIDAAHRVVGHEGGRGKCARLHGHTYLFELTLKARRLDETGFIVDYGELKRVLDEWDHRTLLWEKDPLGLMLSEPTGDFALGRADGEPEAGVVRLAFNPTAENMARHIAERLFVDHPVLDSIEVVVRETAKSRARWVIRRQGLDW